MKTFSPEELARHDGRDDKPTFVAVEGTVYDLSGSKKWIHGVHMKRHSAGGDLSADIKAAPHGPDVLERFPVAGELVLEPTAPMPGLRGMVEALLDKHPFFRRHPHPAVVHYPVGLLTAAPMFYLAALVTGSTATEWAVVCCLVAGLATIPAAIATGYFTWWVNYEAKDGPIIHTKRRLAWSALLLCIVTTAVRLLAVTEPLRITDTNTIAYVALLLVLAALAGLVGFLGGRLTFPYE